jgi:hypothetical protein
MPPLALRPSVLRACDALLACDDGDVAAATAAADALDAECEAAYGKPLHSCGTLLAPDEAGRVPSPTLERHVVWVHLAERMRPPLFASLLASTHAHAVFTLCFLISPALSFDLLERVLLAGGGLRAALACGARAAEELQRTGNQTAFTEADVPRLPDVQLESVLRLLARALTRPAVTIELRRAEDWVAVLTACCRWFRPSQPAASRSAGAAGLHDASTIALTTLTNSDAGRGALRAWRHCADDFSAALAAGLRRQAALGTRRAPAFEPDTVISLCALLCNCTPAGDTATRPTTATFNRIAAHGVVASLRTLLLDSPLFAQQQASPMMARRVLLDAIGRVALLPGPPALACAAPDAAPDAALARDVLRALLAIWCLWPREPDVRTEALCSAQYFTSSPAAAYLLGDWAKDGKPSEAAIAAAYKHALHLGWCDVAGLHDATARAEEEDAAAARAAAANRAAAATADTTVSLTRTLGTSSAPRPRSETPAARCDACGALRMADAPLLKVCGRCRRAFYCDAACQAAHWREHRVHGCTPRGGTT